MGLLIYAHRTEFREVKMRACFDSDPYMNIPFEQTKITLPKCITCRCPINDIYTWHSFIIRVEGGTPQRPLLAFDVIVCVAILIGRKYCIEYIDILYYLLLQMNQYWWIAWKNVNETWIWSVYSGCIYGWKHWKLGTKMIMNVLWKVCKCQIAKWFV